MTFIDRFEILPARFRLIPPFPAGIMQSSSSAPVPSAPNAAPGALRRALRTLLAVVAVTAVIAAIGDAAIDRNEAMERATARAEATAKLVDLHIRRILRNGDFVLGQAIEIARTDDASIASARLRVVESALLERGRLSISDADGRVVLTSRPIGGAPRSIADRPYFKAHRDGATSQISPLGPSIDGETICFTLSRRIDDPSGRMSGLAILEIDAADSSHFFSALGLGEGAIIGVFARDGGVILRQPSPERVVGTSIAGGYILRAAALAPQGVVPLMVSMLDGIHRLVAYRTLENADLIAVAGIAVDEALTGWWRARMVTAGVLAAFALVLIAVAIIASRALRRETEAIHGLERAVAERTEEARHQAEQARLANDGKTRFLAAASHDLRQPLQAAGMFVEVLAARLGDSPHQTVIAKLRQSVEATGALLSILLDVSTLESGKVHPNITAFPLMPLLASLADQMEPEAEAAGLRLRVAPSSAWVFSDRVLLERLLRNLLVNALRYTASGGVLLGCRHRPGEELAIEVVDTGIGIPADKQDLIFEDFTRLDGAPPKSNQSRGPGLGLGVARRMAHLLGHRIELRSEVGKGSTFRVVVPLARPRRVP